MKKRINEGEIFAVPLSNNTFGVGLIARYHDDGILAFFLNKSYDTLPSLNKIEFEEDSVVYVVIASALGLTKGVWPILGYLRNWDREKWKVPIFYKNDLIENTLVKIFYDDQLKFIKEEIVDDDEEHDLLPKDGIAGYEFVEKRLTRLLLNR